MPDFGFLILTVNNYLMFNTNLFFGNWGRAGNANPLILATSTTSGAPYIVGYSTNGSTWTGSPSSNSLLTADQGISSNYRNGIWVVGAGSAETNKIIYSTDSGVNWATSSTANSLFSRVDAIASSSTTFVCSGGRTADGSSSILAYSTDGATLTNSANGNTLFPSSTDRILGICHDGSKFIAVGISSANYPIVTSTDGITWTRSNSIAASFNTVCFNGSIYVAAGNGTLYTSTDAISWTSRSLPSGFTLFRTLGWNGSYFIAGGGANVTGSSAVIMKSTDAITWSTINSGERQLNTVYDVTWDGTKWTAVGAMRTIPSGNTPILTSTDGTTWSNSGNSQTIFGTVCASVFSVPSPEIYPPVFS
jgi:hypothetical protein